MGTLRRKHRTDAKIAIHFWARCSGSWRDTMLEDGKIFIGKSTKPEYLNLRLANRHGLVTGATGTGKTVSLQVMAEGLSNAGVPVFAADIKGDLSGVAEAGEGKDAFVRRAKEIGVDYTP